MSASLADALIKVCEECGAFLPQRSGGPGGRNRKRCDACIRLRKIAQKTRAKYWRNSFSVSLPRTVRDHLDELMHRYDQPATRVVEELIRIAAATPPFTPRGLLDFIRR